MNQNSLRVTAFTSYQEYLEQVYRQRKAEKSPYSYQVFATELGFAPTNVIRLVVRRERKLAKTSVQRIVDHLPLHGVDRRYFMAMVAYNNAKTISSKEKHFGAMIHLRLQAAEPQTKDQLEFFSRWYHPIIKEALLVAKGVGSPDEISNRLYPYVSREQVEESLQLLQRLGMIVGKQESGGFTINPEQNIFLPEKNQGVQIGMMGFHKQMLQLSSSSLDLVPDEERDFNALTVAVSRSALGKLKNKIQDLCKEALMEESQSSRQEIVAQLNIQLFALTK